MYEHNCDNTEMFFLLRLVEERIFLKMTQTVLNITIWREMTNFLHFSIFILNVLAEFLKTRQQNNLCNK